MTKFLSVLKIDKQIKSLNELPSRIQRGFEAAKAASSYSDGYLKRERMGAAIFAGSRLLSIGFNQYSKSRPDNKFFKISQDNKIIEYCKATHCEQCALDKIKYSENYTDKKLIMYVYREGANGEPTASAPCQMCQAAIKRSDISVVRFFTFDGEYKEWKVN